MLTLGKITGSTVALDLSKTTSRRVPVLSLIFRYRGNLLIIRLALKTLQRAEAKQVRYSAVCSAIFLALNVDDSRKHDRTTR